MFFFKWQKGRQNDSYEKLKIFSFWFFDCYILRFREEAEVLPHMDPVLGKKHFRLNITLKRSSFGGITYAYYCNKNSSPNIISRMYNDIHKRIILFRPDIMEHGLTKVTEGTKYILSIGWVV